MPSTIQIVVSQTDDSNYSTESVNDTFVTQHGRHQSGTVGTAGAYWSQFWPTTGETMVYMKFPQMAQSYNVSVIHDTSVPSPLFVTIPAGTGFIPVMLPEPPPAHDGYTYYSIESTVPIPNLPLYYF